MKPRLPKWNERKGWIGGDSRTLYLWTDTRTGKSVVRPVKQFHGGDANKVRIATRSEAERHEDEGGWPHAGWTTAEDYARGRNPRAGRQVDMFHAPGLFDTLVRK